MKHVPSIFRYGMLLGFICAIFGFLCRYLGMNDRALAFAYTGMLFLGAAAFTTFSIVCAAALRRRRASR